MSVPTAVWDDSAPTLELEQFAVRSASSAWATPLSLCSRARRVGLVGDWQPLFQLLSGRSQAISGSAKVLNCELERAVSSGLLGFAAADPPLPGSFTVGEYLRHAARLSHGSASRAVHDAQRALDRYGLAELEKKKLAELALYQRRALGIALSTLTAPAMVCLEAPLRDLDAPSAEYVARLCGQAGAHGRLLLSSAQPRTPSPERSLLDTCDELFERKQDGLLTHGSPSSLFATGARYAITVKGPQLAGFLQALRDTSVQLEARAQAGSFSVVLPEHASTDLLLDTALDHGLIVLELEPLFAV